MKQASISTLYKVQNFQRTKFISLVTPTLIIFIDLYHNFVNYFNFQYTSDGFFVYSFLRNIATADVFYEGPRFEWMLGVHSYLTLIFIAIPVWIFKTPLVLVAIVSFLNLVSCIIIAKIGFLFENRAIYIFGPILFLLLPLVRDTRNGTMYLFQPDWIAIPIILYLAYALLSENLFGSLASSFLLILNKEEWILQFPLLILFLFFALNKKDFILKNLMSISVTYLGTSIISVLSFLYFRSRNFNEHPVPIDLRNSVPSIFDFFPQASFQIFIIFAPYFIILFLFTLYKSVTEQTFKHLFVFFLLIGLFHFRFVILNVTIYGDPFSGSLFWSTHALLTPLMIISLLMMTPKPTHNNLSSRNFFVFLLFSVLIFPTWKLIDRPIYPDSIGTSNSLVQPVRYISQSIPNIGWNGVERYRCLKQFKFSPEKEAKSYFISSHLVMAPFMELSHLPLDWVTSQENPKSLFMNAEGVVLNKKDLTEDVQQTLNDLGFSLIQQECEDQILIFKKL